MGFSILLYPPFVRRVISTMSRIQEEIDFVKGQLKRTKSIHDKNPFNGSKLPDVIKGFEQVIRRLESVRDNPAEASKSASGVSPLKQEQLYLLPKDLEDLPEELLTQLNQSKSDKLELNILKSLEDAGGVLSIDVLLVRLYRLTKQIYDRRQLSAKLFRMTKKGLIFSVPKKKSVYSISPIDPSLLEDEENDEPDDEE